MSRHTGIIALDRRKLESPAKEKTPSPVPLISTVIVIIFVTSLLCIVIKNEMAWHSSGHGEVISEVQRLGGLGRVTKIHSLPESYSLVTVESVDGKEKASFTMPGRTLKEVSVGDVYTLTAVYHQLEWYLSLDIRVSSNAKAD